MRCKVESSGYNGRSFIIFMHQACFFSSAQKWNGLKSNNEPWIIHVPAFKKE